MRKKQSKKNLKGFNTDPILTTPADAYTFKWSLGESSGVSRPQEDLIKMLGEEIKEKDIIIKFLKNELFK